MDIQINYLSVIVAAIVGFVIGWLWYGPLFGKTWAGLMGWSGEQMKAKMAESMTQTMVVAFVGQLVMAYVLAHFVVVWNVTEYAGAFQLAFWSWLGLVAPVLLGQILWESKPTKLYLINVFHYLVVIYAMVLVLGYWK